MSQQEGVGVFKVGGSVAVDVAGLGLLDVSRTPFGAAHLPTFLEDVLEGVAVVVAEPEQEHRLVAAEDRQLELPEQVPQSAGGQAEEVVEEGGGVRRGPEELVVKQSGGFGPATDSRLETDRDPTYLRARRRERGEERGGGTVVPGSAGVGMVDKTLAGR